MPPQKRRQSDHSDLIKGAAKATVAFIFFGVLSFVGSWWVSLSSTVAKVKEDVAVIHEKQDFLGTWLVDEMKRTREDLKDLRGEVKAISSLQGEVSRISAEQARRTAVIDSIKHGTIRKNQDAE